jgi:SAM-dependent methyltransferase
MRKELHEANRLSWNAATVAHNSHKGDQAAFLRQGGSTLFPEELELLGDISGAALVHLQCNAGQDSLSLAQLGATVTGVDISDEAIACAQRLSADSGIPATFIRADVFDWFDAVANGAQRFDIVFYSYGALCWISDLFAWARGVASVLRKGGRVVGVEFHPFAWMFDPDWNLRYDYFRGGIPLDDAEGVNDYVAASGQALVPWGFEPGESEFQNPHSAHEFQWGIGEIITALLAAGLTLEALREYPYANGALLFNRMRELAGRRWAPPDGVPSLPLMYGIVARQAGSSDRVRRRPTGSRPLKP